jgi:hypothetical protein
LDPNRVELSLVYPFRRISGVGGVILFYFQVVEKDKISYRFKKLNITFAVI